MNRALLAACYVAFFLAMPLLLAARAFRPNRTPWWLVVVLAAIIGAAFSALEFHFYVPWAVEAQARENPYALVDYAEPPAYVGVMFGLGYLAICLVPYWVFFARRRGRSPAARSPN